jgi:hypothetical protein
MMWEKKGEKDTLKLYLKMRFPTSSAFHALTNAKSPVMAFSMMYGFPLNVSAERLLLAISTLKTLVIKKWLVNRQFRRHTISSPSPKKQNNNNNLIWPSYKILSSDPHII